MRTPTLTPGLSTRIIMGGDRARIVVQTASEFFGTVLVDAVRIANVQC